MCETGMTHPLAALQWSGKRAPMGTFRACFNQRTHTAPLQAGRAIRPRKAGGSDGSIGPQTEVSGSAPPGWSAWQVGWLSRSLISAAYSAASSAACFMLTCGIKRTGRSALFTLISRCPACHPKRGQPAQGMPATPCSRFWVPHAGRCQPDGPPEHQRHTLLPHPRARTAPRPLPMPAMTPMFGSPWTRSRCRGSSRPSSIEGGRGSSSTWPIHTITAPTENST